MLQPVAVGSKSLSPDGVRNLLEGRFIDAIQATAAGLTMDSLHDKRAEFVRVIRETVRENLAHSGLQLESVSLTRISGSSSRPSAPVVTLCTKCTCSSSRSFSTRWK